MARPRKSGAKHRREYLIMCVDSSFTCKYFLRDGYKSHLLREYTSRFPHCDLYIYVLSGTVISNSK